MTTFLLSCLRQLRQALRGKRRLITVLLLLTIAVPAAAQPQLTVESGGTVTVSNGALNLGGDFANNGTFDASNGTVSFIGTTNQTFSPGAGATIQSLTVNQASANAVLLANPLSVTGLLTVSNGDLNLNGQVIDLGTTGMLDEADGQTVTGTSGHITATRFLNAPNAVNVGGLGARITSDENMSATTVTRGHAPQTGSSSNEGIARYFDIQPGVNSGLNATLEFFYDDTELNGLDETTLELWRSDDGGSTFTAQGGTVSPSVDVIAMSGIDSFSRWTATSSGAPLPVELAGFDALRDDDTVTLRWKTLSEKNSATFEIQRSTSTLDDPGDREWSAIGHKQAAGTTDEPQTYRFEDTDVPYEAQTVHYRLKQVDVDGTETYYGEAKVLIRTGNNVTLHGNFPNPVRSETTIRYELPEAGEVQLAVFDLLGRRVRTLVDGPQTAGRKEIRMNASTLPSGSYFYRLQVDSQTMTRRMTVVR
ncbi:hypothetical protein CRI94_15040 [Longibacter salinarum]|uniref:Secretion system C-terminal sorting domain-containing protein n=1 Tax=Longibacter salinarum TaxID=1850348 RepID=A0A2A8CV03_9BACT|nr:T9SS type A sorting domain-containing protein [Longibacter salinarum]PEN12333.1 hypothetical protein CRI94_15040 [Longibacter salinarum]